MLIPCDMDTQREGTEKSIKTQSKRERRQNIDIDRKMFSHFQTKHSIYFLNSHSLTFIRCHVVFWAQMHRLNAERCGEGVREKRAGKNRGWLTESKGWSGREEKMVGRLKEEGQEVREWEEGTERLCYAKAEREKEVAIYKGRARTRAYAICQKRGYRKKRDDAICGDTDGVCDPAVMSGRRVPQTTSSSLRRKRQHGGGQNKEKLLGPIMSLCNSAAIASQVELWWLIMTPSFQCCVPAICSPFKMSFPQPEP